MKLITGNFRHKLLDVVPLSTPYTMYIDPSGKCNFKCKFCPCNNSDYMSDERHQVMEFELFEKAVLDIQQFDEQIKAINLYGFGEPLLNPRFVDMVKLLRKRNICRDIRTCTNGVLLTPELNQELIDSSINLVTISVEALSTEGYREITGTMSSYEKIYEAVKDLYQRSRGSNTKIAVKLINSTLTGNEDIALFKTAWGAYSDYFWWEEQSHAWQDFKIASITTDETDGKRVITYSSKEEGKKHICSWPLINMSVCANGSVVICCGDWKMDTLIGNIKNESLFDIWNGEAIHKKRIALLENNRLASSESCHTCITISNDNVDNDAQEILQKIQALRLKNPTVVENAGGGGIIPRLRECKHPSPENITSDASTITKKLKKHRELQE